MILFIASSFSYNLWCLAIRFVCDQKSFIVKMFFVSKTYFFCVPFVLLLLSFSQKIFSSGILQSLSCKA